ncbi:MAG: hypothetical protein JRI25_03855 [Deltaproteobacteria bacterium]|nr:hypothetical protein [Deltaproteobacteria bacterium]
MTAIVRAMQIETLYGVAGVLDCEGVAKLEAPLPDWATYGWRLFSLDESGKPSQAVESLGETLDGYDPAGSESVFSSQGG